MNTKGECQHRGQPGMTRATLAVAVVVSTIFALTALLASFSAAVQAGDSVIPAGQSSVITVTTTFDELWTNGVCSLREAIQAANTNAPVDTCPAGSGEDTIILPPGVYTLLIAYGSVDSAYGDLDVFDALTIQGHRSDDTIIDAEAIDRVLHVHDVHLAVHDVTLRNGESSGGGGIRVKDGVLTARNVMVTQNDGGSQGGGIIAVGGTLALVNCQITENYASAGSGIHVDGSSTLLLQQSLLSGNAGGYAPIMNNGGVVTITDSVISGNRAVTDGAIQNTPAGTLSVENSTIVGNESYRDYDGVQSGGLTNYGRATIVGSTLHGNRTLGGGGSIVNHGSLSILNSTISGNEGLYGAGIVNSRESQWGVFAGTLDLESVTIAQNTATNQGGGLYVASGAIVTASNVLITHNIGGDCLFEVGSSGSVTSASLDSDSSCPGFATGAAVLGPLASNGGPTFTHLPMSADIIDSGGGGSCPATDQRGVHRPQDGNGDGGAECDLGAVEVVPVLLSAVSLDGPGTGDVCVETVFTATAAPISATLPISYTWQSAGQEPIRHTSAITDVAYLLWETPGSKLLEVTAANTLSAVSGSHAVTVAETSGDLPIARLTAFNDGPTTLRHSTTLTATYVCGTNATLAWDLGDGATAVGPIVSHTYEAPGTYTATVTASNDAGTAAAQTTVSVRRAIYMPAFVFSGG